jgi:hypothetical protein
MAGTTLSRMRSGESLADVEGVHGVLELLHSDAGPAAES